LQFLSLEINLRPRKDKQIWEDFVKFHIFVFFAFIALISGFTQVSAQANAAIGQVTSSVSDAFVNGISGDGRFVVFESSGNVATENPRNTDNNREIFLFDYAQRRIFQITDTKSLLTDPTMNPIFSNIKVDIFNTRPVISTDGRWIAFGSNATTSTPSMPNSTNPGSFDGNSFTTMSGTNPLTSDGNTEIWFYEIPPVTPVDLSSGDEIPYVDLSTGTFTRVTNTLPSRLPVPGSTTNLPIIADDNRDLTINDNGNFIAFTSNRDLVPTVGNPFPSADNDEIFAFIRSTMTANFGGTGGTMVQVTQTPRGTIGNPIYNANAVISGNGLRIAFQSNANNPIVGMMGGTNSDNNEEIFFADIDAGGTIGNRKQVTATTRTNPGDVVNTFYYGRRMSRDGRFIAFDSFADLANEHSGTNQNGFATFVYDSTLTTNTFRRVCARSDADSGATGGDIARYPTFTDYDVSGVPQTLVMETRMNIKPDGTIPTNATEGLNNIAARPAQIYSFPLNIAPANAIFTRISKFQSPSFFLGTIQPITTNTVKRMTFSLGDPEVGTGNDDASNEVYYLLLPTQINLSSASFNFSTGASRIPVSASPVPTPTPTATPTPTPTPSPSPTPTATPTPQTPPAVQGVSPGMLAILDYDSGLSVPTVARTATGSIERRFTLPIELSGISMSINGAAVGLKTVSRRQIVFVVPPGLTASDAGTSYPVVINNNGTVFKGTIVVVPARPDLFTRPQVLGGGGRVNAFNVTNRVFTTEPFTITTFRLRGSRRVPSVIRLYLTGVNNIFPTRINGAQISVRIGDITINGVLNSTPTLVEPGVYTVDFQLPPTLAGAGDRPIVVTVTVNGITYISRLDDTAPRISIL
jgi:hypothetical protein